MSSRVACLLPVQELALFLGPHLLLLLELHCLPPPLQLAYARSQVPPKLVPAPVRVQFNLVHNLHWPHMLVRPHPALLPSLDRCLRRGPSRLPRSLSLMLTVTRLSRVRKLIRTSQTTRTIMLLCNALLSRDPRDPGRVCRLGRRRRQRPD